MLLPSGAPFQQAWLEEATPPVPAFLLAPYAQQQSLMAPLRWSPAWRAPTRGAWLPVVSPPATPRTHHLDAVSSSAFSSGAMGFGAVSGGTLIGGSASSGVAAGKDIDARSFSSVAARAVASGVCTPIREPKGARFLGISPAVQGSPWQPVPMPKFTLDCSPQATAHSTTTPPHPRRKRRSLEQDIADAMEQGSASLLKLALTRSSGCSPCHCLHELVMSRNYRALEFLLWCDADKVDEHCQGLRPLHLALQLCLAEGDDGFRMLDLLLAHGARPDRLDGDAVGGSRRDSPLHDAARRCNAGAVELLLSYGADPNILDMVGNSALHVLCQHAAPWGGRLGERAAALLLLKGAHPVPNAMGRQPSCYARDPVLRAKLLRAENWYARVCLRTALGRAGADVAGIGDIGGSGVITLLPEVFESIACFL